MTVKELIEELSKYDSDALVVLQHEDGCEFVEDTVCTLSVKTDGYEYIDAEEEDPEDWESYPWKPAVLIY